jgi:EAL domain-containing protein (putative c-di-GMP-specific phosphodiesterase class I)/signal transduction histidine kinase/FixJ family two-component response regulator
VNQQLDKLGSTRFDPEDRRCIDAFWEFYASRSVGHDARRHELCSIAVATDRWEPFLEELRSQGAQYASSGVSFKKWFEEISAYRGAVRELLARYTDHGTTHRDESDSIVRGMNSLLYLVIETVGEGFLSSRERLVIEDALAREEHLRQTQKLDAIGRLAGGVAHDFNNALAVISVYSAFLEEDLDESDRRRVDATEIRRAGERAKALTRKLSMLSCNSVVAPTALDLDERIADFEPTLKRLIDKQINLVVERSKVPSVLADAEQLEQVLMNLVVNANEAMPDGGRITIELAVKTVDDIAGRTRGIAPMTYVVICVSDTGGGIDKEAQRRIFEPYFTTKPDKRNSGLGLAIVQGIVAQAGGHVTVYSEVGHGTTVRVHLPAMSDGVIVQPIAVISAELMLQPATVLIVDDQPELRAGLVRVLQASGCATLEADSAEMARRLCVSHDSAIDVVLFDVILGDGRGDQMITLLQALRPGIKVILMSGFPAGALSTGGAPVELLAKPFSASELRHAIARAMQKAPEPDGPRAGTATVGKHTRVLVVDDDAQVRSAVVRTLHSSELEIIAVSGGEAAVAEVEKAPFDVIVCDVMMPTMTGLEFLRAVRRSDLDVPVILMTGAPTIEGATTALEYGAFRYMTKPFEPGALVKAVRHAARAHALARLRREAFQVGGVRAGAVDRAGLEARFEKAMEGVFMVFQPIVDAQSGMMFGFEALLRTTELSLPAPAAMLDAAALLGRLPQLGRHIRALSAAMLATRTDDAALFVNLHPDDLYDTDLVDEAQLFTQLAPRIVLEVTERASLAISPALTERLARLRALGFRLAIDDIGSGYSGLTSFTELDPEIVKLDMSIVRDVQRNVLKQRTIRALCQLCHEGGSLVVAEGVETMEERACLRDLGCDLLQGYLIARPARELASYP